MSTTDKLNTIAVRARSAYHALGTEGGLASLDVPVARLQVQKIRDEVAELLDELKAAPVGAEQDSKVTHRYFVAVDGPLISRLSPAKLYRQGVESDLHLAGSGTVEQMRALADELNGGRS